MGFKAKRFDNLKEYMEWVALEGEKLAHLQVNDIGGFVVATYSEKVNVHYHWTGPHFEKVVIEPKQVNGEPVVFDPKSSMGCEPALVEQPPFKPEFDLVEIPVGHVPADARTPDRCLTVKPRSRKKLTQQELPDSTTAGAILQSQAGE